MSDLQELAEDYLKAHLKCKAIQAKMDEIQRMVNESDREMVSIGNKLLESVGRNVPRKVFKVGDDRVLIVDYRELYDNIITIDSFQ